MNVNKINVCIIPHVANPSLKISGKREVCPGEYRIFSCETRGSRSLSWMSNEYIGQRGIQLILYKYLPVGTLEYSHKNPNVFANLTFKGYETGVKILRSQLHVTIPTDTQNTQHSITCLNRGLSTRSTTTVQMSGTFYIIVFSYWKFPCQYKPCIYKFFA